MALVGKLRSVTRTIGGDMLLGVATMATPIVGFITNFIGARYIEPDQMGIYQTLMLIPAYSGFLHFGVFNGIGRNIPFYHGRGDVVKVQLIVNASWRVVKTLSLANIILCIIVSLYLWWSGYSKLYLWTMSCIIIIMATDPYFSHLDYVYRGVRHYTALGRKTILINLLSGIGAMLPMIAGYWGYLWGRILQAAIRIPLLYRQVPFKSSETGKIPEIIELSRTGFPLLIAGVLYGYLGVADRSVVAVMLGPSEVGHLTLSSLVVASVQFTPVALTTLLYPRIAAEYGKGGTSIGLHRYFWITLFLSIVTVIPISVVTWLFIGPFTLRFLPRYSAGIPAAEIAALGSIGFLYFGVGAVIAVVRRNTLYIVAILFSLLLVWGLGAILILMGYGIEGAAFARAIATTMLCIFTVTYAYYITTNEVGKLNIQ